ncbi:MAG: hypothetical protein PHI24_14330 [Desulfitobacteriaceae bacterium]|nr:hypothetical protein [Desulfitobacteriaceae bacterium]
MIIAEAIVHVVPFIKNYLDTKNPEFLAFKFVVLATGIVLNIVLKLFLYQRPVKYFEAWICK